MSEALDAFVGNEVVVVRRAHVPEEVWRAVGTTLIATGAELSYPDQPADAVVEQAAAPVVASVDDFRDYALSIGLSKVQGTKAYAVLGREFYRWLGADHADEEFPVRFGIYTKGTDKHWTANDVDLLDVRSLRDYLAIIDLRLAQAGSARKKIKQVYDGLGWGIGEELVKFWRGYVAYALPAESPAGDSDYVQ